MRVRMLMSLSASSDGINVQTLERGKSYDLPESQARRYLDKNLAEEDKAIDQAPEIKVEVEPIVKKKKRSRKA